METFNLMSVFAVQMWSQDMVRLEAVRNSNIYGIAGSYVLNVMANSQEH